MLHLLIQLAAIVNFAYTIYWDLYILKLPGRPSFGGQWKYLTFINLWIQLIYFSVSFFNNFIGSQATDSTKASKLQKCRDYLFATLAFPIGQFVGIIFWVLFHIDRELVFPLHYDNFFPNYINHAMHTTVIPAQLLELFLQYHAYPSKRFNGMSTTMIFCFVYLTWTLIVAHFGGVWVIIFLRLNFKRASNLFVKLHFLLQVKGITSVCSKYFVTFRRSRYLNSAVWRLEGVNSTILEPSLFQIGINFGT